MSYFGNITKNGLIKLGFLIFTSVSILNIIVNGISISEDRILASFITFVLIISFTIIGNISYLESGQKYFKLFFYVTLTFCLLVSLLAIGFATDEKVGVGAFIILNFIYFGSGVALSNFLTSIYGNNNFNNTELTSYLNPLRINRGHKWADFNELKTGLNGEVYIDNFRMIEGKKKWENKIINESENHDLRFEPLDFTKTLLAIGESDSGRNEFLLNIASQNQDFSKFKRELYYDVNGYFTSKLYNPEKDFILNLYDERCLNWDLWEDFKFNENLINTFVHNLIILQIDKIDLLSTTTSSLLAELFKKVHFTSSDLTSAQKWGKFIDLVEAYRLNFNEDKTKQNIWQLLEPLLINIKIMAYYTINNSNKKSFSLYEWANNENSRLFLLNEVNYSKSLNPFFGAFVSCLIEILLTKSDTKSDLTLMIFDNYLSLKLDEDVRLKMLFQSKNKGCCLILGVQLYDKEQQDLFSGSTYAKFIFNTNDDVTIKKIIEAYGSVEWKKSTILKTKSESKSTNSGFYGSTTRTKGTSTSDIREDINSTFITSEMIKSLDDYNHLTLIDEKKLYYVGHTRKVNLLEKNPNFYKRDLTKFYEWLYSL